jgi:hypothetical protein
MRQYVPLGEDILPLDPFTGLHISYHPFTQNNFPEFRAQSGLQVLFCSQEGTVFFRKYFTRF